MPCFFAVHAGRLYIFNPVPRGSRTTSPEPHASLGPRHDLSLDRGNVHAVYLGRNRVLVPPESARGRVERGGIRLLLESLRRLPRQRNFHVYLFGPRLVARDGAAKNDALGLLFVDAARRIELFRRRRVLATKRPYPVRARSLARHGAARLCLPLHGNHLPAIGGLMSDS